MKAATVTKPSNNDVMFEKGLRTQHHPGNIHYRKIIREKAVDYSLAETRNEKDMIAHWALQQMRGKFLTRHDDGTYCVLSKEKVISKIKQALRDRRKQERLNLEDSSKASITATSSKKEVIRKKAAREQSHAEAKITRKIPKNANRVSSSSRVTLDKDMKRLLEICKNL
jgi:hypothetical protein